MYTILHSEIFFFISSVGFITLWVFLAVLLFQINRAVNTWNRIIDRVASDVDAIGDTTKEMIEDVHDSSVFRFLFKKKKHKKSLKQ